jgi:hypothetical protein
MNQLLFARLHNLAHFCREIFIETCVFSTTSKKDKFLLRLFNAQLQMASGKLISAHQVQQVLRQQPWFAGCCRTCVSYTDTHCSCISKTDGEHAAYCYSMHTNFVGMLLQIFANQANPFYFVSHPIKNQSFLMDKFKNFISVGVPYDLKG